MAPWPPLSTRPCCGWADCTLASPACLFHTSGLPRHSEMYRRKQLQGSRNLLDFINFIAIIIGLDYNGKTFSGWFSFLDNLHSPKSQGLHRVAVSFSEGFPFDALHRQLGRHGPGLLGQSLHIRALLRSRGRVLATSPQSKHLFATFERMLSV